jgi:hypothetical protein
MRSREAVGFLGVPVVIRTEFVGFQVGKITVSNFELRIVVGLLELC